MQQTINKNYFIQRRSHEGTNSFYRDNSYSMRKLDSFVVLNLVLEFGSNSVVPTNGVARNLSSLMLILRFDLMYVSFARVRSRQQAEINIEIVSRVHILRFEKVRSGLRFPQSGFLKTVLRLAF